MKTPITNDLGDGTRHFIPLRFNKLPIYLKTPKMIVPFGLNNFETERQVIQSCVVSFDDRDLDPNIEDLFLFVNSVEQYFYQLAQQHPPQWNFQFRDGIIQFKSSIKGSCFRLKIRPQTEIYDEVSQLCTHNEGCHLIIPWCQVMTLLELSGLWMFVKDDVTTMGLSWKVIQLRVYPPTKPMGGVSLLDENIVTVSSPSLNGSDSISLPPPPPPPMPPPPPIIVSQPLFPMITDGKYHLKKAIKNDPYQGSQPIVSLAEILKIKRGLRGRPGPVDSVTLQQ